MRLYINRLAFSTLVSVHCMAFAVIVYFRSCRKTRICLLMGQMQVISNKDNLVYSPTVKQMSK